MRGKVRSKSILICTAILSTALLYGCAGVDGVFEPACTAYEGDRLTLRNGRFEWSRFTDVRSIDGDGNEIDPFPGYPKLGRYEVDATKVEFHADDRTGLEDYFLLEQNGSLYLLTGEQNVAAIAGQGLPDCPLRRSK